MKMNDEILKRLENLAYLEIKDEKREEIKQDLNEIISFVDSINEIDTSGVSEHFSMEEIPMRLRQDTPEKNTCIDEILAQTPHKIDSFFKVPRIIE